MHIAFLSSDRVGAGAFDRDTALIGAFEALGVKVTVIEPTPPPAARIERWRSALFRRMGYNVSTACDVSRLRGLAYSVGKALSGTEADIIFSRSTHFTAWLNTPLPVVNYVDAVFDCIVDFYPSHTHLDFLSLRAGHRAESRALHRSALTILMSSWAAARAIRCYHATESRLGVVQAPAILPGVPSRDEVLAVRSGAQKTLRCLIVGNDWLRKGADIALEAVHKVRGMGLDVRLTTLGMKAPAELQNESWLEILPPLQKGVPEEYAKISQIFLNSDVLFLPSRADFSPHVIAEAYAFGLPVIGSPAGAIPEMIEHGQTGFVTRRIDDVDEYAQLLYQLAAQPGLLYHMAIESRNKYEAEFALPVAARKLVASLEKVCYQGGTAQ
jgi:glycosyltransferase involved in cell wall biosynthesis